MMRYAKGSVDYAVNLQSLHEMEELVPMTLHERECLRRWVKSGHDVDSNPWHYFESDNLEMNYLKARRILFGASHGPGIPGNLILHGSLPPNPRTFLPNKPRNFYTLGYSFLPVLRGLHLLLQTLFSCQVFSHFLSKSSYIHVLQPFFSHYFPFLLHLLLQTCTYFCK